MGETKLLVQRDDLSVKIEVSTVIRGTIYPTRTMPLSPAASDALMADLELPLLSPEDIYGGKLTDCAGGRSASVRNLLQPPNRRVPSVSCLPDDDKRDCYVS